MKKIIQVTISVLFIFVVGCTTTPPRESLVGKWEVKGRQMSVEFFADGTCTIESPIHSNKKASWILLDDSHIKLNCTSSSEFTNDASTYEFSIKGNRILLTDTNNDSKEFIRIK